MPKDLNCESIAIFQSELNEYYLKIKDSTDHFSSADYFSPETSYYSFSELIATIDSLEQFGYKLRFIYGNDGIFEHSLSFVNSVPLSIDSLTFHKKNEINRTCGNGKYAGGNLGHKYFVFYSTQPTGLVREVFYYLIKKD